MQFISIISILIQFFADRLQDSLVKIQNIAISIIILLGNLAFPSGYKYPIRVQPSLFLIVRQSRFIEEFQKNYELALTRRDVDVNANALTLRFLTDPHRAKKFAKFKAQLKPMKASLTLSPASWSDLLPISGNYNPNYKEKAPLSFRLLFAFDNTKGEASLKLVVESSWPSFRKDDPASIKILCHIIWTCYRLSIFIPRFIKAVRSPIIRTSVRLIRVNGVVFLEIVPSPINGRLIRSRRIHKVVQDELIKLLIYVLSTYRVSTMLQSEDSHELMQISYFMFKRMMKISARGNPISIQSILIWYLPRH